MLWITYDADCDDKDFRVRWPVFLMTRRRRVQLSEQRYHCSDEGISDELDAFMILLRNNGLSLLGKCSNIAICGYDKHKDSGKNMLMTFTEMQLTVWCGVLN